MIPQHDTPKIVIVDGYTANPGDLSWTGFHKLGDVSIYERSTRKEALERAKDADILLVNKIKADADMITALPNLKYIGVMATGYNNVNLEAANERNIPVCNASGYSTRSVAQQVFALLLELTNRVGDHNQSVQNGKWANSADFCYTLQILPELADLTFGIYALGAIGNKVADIALAFGMKVIAYHKHPKRDARPGVVFVSEEELLERSDVLSLHAPLNDQSRHFINVKSLKKMKQSAYLINTSRGGLIDETALRDAVLNEDIKGAALDVLTQEPPAKDNPLINVPNIILTPHVAWATQDARQRLLTICVENIEAFLKGEPQNVVNNPK